MNSKTTGYQLPPLSATDASWCYNQGTPEETWHAPIRDAETGDAIALTEGNTQEEAIQKQRAIVEAANGQAELMFALRKMLIAVDKPATLREGSSPFWDSPDGQVVLATFEEARALLVRLGVKFS